MFLYARGRQIADEQGVLRTHVGEKGAAAHQEHIEKETNLEVWSAIATKTLNVNKLTDRACGEIDIEYTTEKPIRLTSAQRVLLLVPG